MTGASARLDAVQRARASVLSVGLEPCAEYLPAGCPGFEDTIDGHERFLRTVIDAASGRVCAFKLNLAFFEALGEPGWALLHRVRRAIPEGHWVIADAKRGDIGTSAVHYARAMFDHLGADSVTVNPLMGRDAVEPFLGYADRLTYLLALTSNPGAQDFLTPGDLYLRIVQRAQEWTLRDNLGFVVGATRPEQAKAVRAAAPRVPFLVPGVGAQGGALEATVRACARAGGDSAAPGLVIHVTRGVLPDLAEATRAGSASAVRAIIEKKIELWNGQCRTALGALTVRAVQDPTGAAAHG